MSERECTLCSSVMQEQKFALARPAKRRWTELIGSLNPKMVCDQRGGLLIFAACVIKSVPASFSTTMEQKPNGERSLVPASTHGPLHKQVVDVLAAPGSDIAVSFEADSASPTDSAWRLGDTLLALVYDAGPHSEIGRQVNICIRKDECWYCGATIKGSAFRGARCQSKSGCRTIYCGAPCAKMDEKMHALMCTYIWSALKDSLAQ